METCATYFLGLGRGKLCFWGWSSLGRGRASKRPPVGDMVALLASFVSLARRAWGVGGGPWGQGSCTPSQGCSQGCWGDCSPIAPLHESIVSPRATRVARGKLRARIAGSEGMALGFECGVKSVEGYVWGDSTPCPLSPPPPPALPPRTLS